VPDSHRANETRDLPGKGNDLSRPRSEHRVERVAPEDRRPLPYDEPDEGERGETETPPERAQRRRRRLLIAAVVGALLLVGAIVPGWYWYTTWRWLESTDDAYTQADNTAIVPRVSGYISELLVTDNQRVKAGEVLLRIDPRDYQAAVLKEGERKEWFGDPTIQHLSILAAIFIPAFIAIELWHKEPFIDLRLSCGAALPACRLWVLSSGWCSMAASTSCPFIWRFTTSSICIASRDGWTLA
jgi:hypothetical protein